MMTFPPARGLPGVNPPFDFDLKSPLNDKPAGFPCGGKPASPNLTPLTAGQPFTVTLEGEAVHSGGHCQLALLYTSTGAMTRDSPFVVVKDVFRDCLVKDRNIEVTIPADAPQGRAVFAWTWINAIGNREYYMNCADVEIQSNNPPTNTLKGPKLLVVNLPGFDTIGEFGFGADDGSAMFAARPIIE
ncbi:hypothetical protein HK102_002711, partial [Quaeritorhiza haematococci]